MKTRFWAGVFAATFLAAVFLNGRLTDFFFSRWLSGQSHLDVRVSGVILKNWPVLSFGSLQIRGRDGRVWASARSGFIRSGKGGHTVRLGDALLYEKAFGSPFLKFLSPGSASLRVKGGFLLRAGRVVKAHALVSLPEDFLKRLPGRFSSKVIPVRGMPRSVRVVYGGQVLEIAGARTPFFRAQWSGVGN
ncbi:MAG: hypothetical protein HYZ52_02580 [Candidatus Omnitrophica bacterium]|nr:hypothetical protein [Candidatus Omnitrophota bacterium]